MTELRVAQRIPRTGAEGPGERYALWVQGCSIRCAGCCNPEMFAERGGEAIQVEWLAEEMLAEKGLEGVTFLGGEPFDQAPALAELARSVRARGLSVMVFTGYVREELERSLRPGARELLAQTDLLADGPFMQELPPPRFRWLGSGNQRLHVLTDRYREDDPRFFEPNTVDIRVERGQIHISGWAPTAMALMKRAR